MKTTKPAPVEADAAGKYDAKRRVLRSLDSLPFADLVLKPTAINGTEPKDATDNALTIKASGVDIGFWQCSPGTFKTARKGVNEVILVLEGKQRWSPRPANAWTTRPATCS